MKKFIACTFLAIALIGAINIVGKASGENPTCDSVPQPPSCPTVTLTKTPTITVVPTLMPTPIPLVLSTYFVNTAPIFGNNYDITVLCDAGDPTTGAGWDGQSDSGNTLFQSVLDLQPIVVGNQAGWHAAVTVGQGGSIYAVCLDNP